MELVNGHIHTPWSFSAFDSVDHAVSLARSQNVRALGISDFNTVEGYTEFNAACCANKIYPIFGMESITLLREDKEHGIKWNDPKNPGIIYISGKSLDYPVNLPPESARMFHELWNGTQIHIQMMIDRVNDWLSAQTLPFTLSYDGIKKRFAKNTVRERHLAMAVYYAIMEHGKSPVDRLALYLKLFNATSINGNIDDPVYIQEQIRNNMLKAGKPAFVEENPDGFLSPEVCNNLILSAGGIPCYPVFADDSIELSPRERDVAVLAETLRTMGYHAVEFIPARNTIDHLKKYVRYFYNNGFCVTFGTEHNTPQLIPMTVSARGGAVFDEELLHIGYEGACILAAHQEQHRSGKPGFVDATGKRLVNGPSMKNFIALGNNAIRKVIS